MAEEFEKRNPEELRKLVREQGRTQFILSEMQRYGYWPADKEQPTLQEEFIGRESKLYRELRELKREQKQQENTKALLRKMRKERMREAKLRRQETKERREADRQARAAAWKEKQANDITYLGEEVSVGLKNEQNNTDRLAANGLPNFQSIREIAAAMGLSVGQLRWLTYNRKVATTSHYQQFQLPKGNGEFRQISAPMPLLKAAQHWTLENILYKIAVTDEAHGFVPGRSILSNALPHVGKTLVINMDLKNFFPTVSYRRVKGLFEHLGYSEKVATVLGLLCTEPETDRLEVDGKQYYVQTGKRALPQGAPSSPALTNILCRKLDARLHGVARTLGFTYTRYADDLTFSGDEAEQGPQIARLLWQVRQIVQNEGFVLHPDKTHIMRRGTRREVTGIVVNEKPNLARKKLRQFRAVVRQIELNGPEGKTWGSEGDLFASLQGFAAHIAMVRPELGKEYLRRIDAIRKQHDPTYRVAPPASPSSDERSSAKERPRSWWERLFGQ